MEDDLVEKSIGSGELQLPSWQKKTHFGIVLWSFAFAVFVPLMVLFYQIYDPASNKNYGVLWFSLILIAIGVFFYLLQKKRLKLTTIKTNISREEFNEIIGKISEKYGWRIDINSSKEIIAKTPFSGRSWGEQVTIIFDGSNLLVNSICDPDKQTSVVSCGRNEQNVRLIVKRINRYKNSNKTINNSYSKETSINPKESVPEKKAQNDKIVIIKNVPIDEIKLAVQKFYDLYNQESIRAIPKMSIISDDEAVITFPFDIDFETFCYFINYLHYPNDIAYKPTIIAWMTTKSDDVWIKNDIRNKKIMLYIPNDDKEYDYVYLTSSDNIGYKMGFAIGEQSQLLKKPKMEFREQTMTISDLKNSESYNFE